MLLSVVKRNTSMSIFDIPEDMWNDMVNFITPEAMEEAVFTDVKQVREENIRGIKDRLEERYERSM